MPSRPPRQHPARTTPRTRRAAIAAVLLSLLAFFAVHNTGPSHPTTTTTSTSSTTETTEPDQGTLVPTTATPGTTPDPAATGRCGVERWDVKTGTDPDAANVNTTPQPATIHDLTSRTSQLTGDRHAPRSTDEEHEYTITATLTASKPEADSDLHLVLTDGPDHMIAEIPAPSCVAPGSPFAAQIAQARTDFLAGQTSTTVTVTGVLFYDFPHGQTGAASNGAELHPVTAVTFR